MSKTITESKIRSIIENIVIQVLSESDNEHIGSDELDDRELLNKLRDPGINMAEIARYTFPDLDEDSARSRLSKISRGVLPLTPELKSKINQYFFKMSQA